MGTQGINYTANVYIWPMDAQAGQCGHTSISVHKDTEENYLGLWPKNGAAANPLTLPLCIDGIAQKKLEHCMEREGDGEVHQAPARQYKIDLNEEQYEKMNNEINKKTAEITAGKVGYTLFAKFNLIGLFSFINNNNKALDKLNEDPFASVSVDNPHIEIGDLKFKKKTHNCSTVVAKVLKKGDVHIENTKMPWGISPLRIDSHLNELAKTNPNIKVTL